MKYYNDRIKEIEKSNNRKYSKFHQNSAQYRIKEFRLRKNACKSKEENILMNKTNK